jgi:hypothetical protein
MLLDDVTWRSTVLNFTEIGQEVWPLWVEIDLRLYENYGCHRADLHENRACSTTLCK